MFEIGGICVALGTFVTSTGEVLYEKGGKYEVLALRKCTCECGVPDINIGILSNISSFTWVCSDCGCEGKSNDEYIWQSSSDFISLSEWRDTQINEILDIKAEI